MSNVVSIKDHFAAVSQPEMKWANPIPLPVGLPSVPTFELDLLPRELRDWVEDIVERFNVPVEYAAVPAMIGAGSLIGSKMGVRPQQHTHWTETANLWGCIVGSPGVMKTPVVNEVFAPLRRLDRQAHETFSNKLAKFEDDVAITKIERDVAEKAARKAVLEGRRTEAESAFENVAERERPKLERYVVNDPTVEKLGEICAENPNGVLVHRDELVTLLADLQREDKAAARGFFLTGWGGSEPYTIDRIGRGTIHIPRVTLSMFGTTQPDKLASYIRTSLTDHNDGMVQRLQLLVWPDQVLEWRNVDRPPNLAAKAVANQCFDRLATLNPESVGAEWEEWYDQSGMPFLRLSGPAAEQMLDFRQRLEATIRRDDLPKGLSEHLCKFRGMIPRLALIHHLASGDTGMVSEEAVAAAIEWAAYLEAHARRAYGSTRFDNADIARAIWKRVEKGDLGDAFTERDIYSRDWSRLQKGKPLQEGLAMLVEHDWLSATKVQTGGRPTTVYRPNPLALGTLDLAA